MKRDHSDADKNKSPDQLERELDATREDIRQTIDEIEDRLSPGQLVDQAVSYLRGSGAQTFFSNLGRSVRDNPMPVALIGTGVAWMMVESGRSDGQRYDGAGLYGYDEPDFDAGDLGYDESDDGSRLSKAKEGFGNATQGLTDHASSAADSARHAARQTSQRMRRAGARARRTGSHARERAREGALHARDQFRHLLDEQPALIGVLGFAAGALLGGMAPRTQREDELMGDLGDDLRHAAARVGSETADQVRGGAERVAESAAREGKREVQRPRGAGARREGESESDEREHRTGRPPMSPPP
jgi:hypothetical protein